MKWKTRHLVFDHTGELLGRVTSVFEARSFAEATNKGVSDAFSQFPLNGSRSEREWIAKTFSGPVGTTVESE